MRKVLLFIIVSLFVTTAGADPVPPRLMRSVKAHHVMKAGLKWGVLRLTTTHPLVSQEFQETVIAEGVCSVLLEDPDRGWMKARIDRVEVLNRDERQGYVFVDARKSCLEFGQIKDAGKRRAHIASRTHACTEGLCDEPVQQKAADEKP